MPKATFPAFAYLRVSSSEQGRGDGFARQRDTIAQYATRAGYTIDDEFHDKMSGTAERALRPGLSALFDRILHNGVRVVIVENSDRLARDLIVGETILKEFRACGVRVVTASGDVDLTDDHDPSKKLIRHILSSIAEFNKTLLVMRMRAARDRRRATTGRCEGRKGFGDRPGEAATIEQMRALRLKRRTYTAIAHALNAAGVPSRTGVPWSRVVVKEILARVGVRRRSTMS